MVASAPDRSDALDKNVYIIGAGFSVAAGVPAVSTFWDRLRKLGESPCRLSLPLTPPYSRALTPGVSPLIA
jgi:hypothetical protein